MTDQTTCPHCGADMEMQWASKTMFCCKTIAYDCHDDPLQSQSCLMKERDMLRAKVAAGYEVLLANYHRVCEERDRLRQQVRDFVIDQQVRKAETGL